MHVIFLQDSNLGHTTQSVMFFILGLFNSLEAFFAVNKGGLGHCKKKLWRLIISEHAFHIYTFFYMLRFLCFCSIMIYIAILGYSLFLSPCYFDTAACIMVSLFCA